MSANQKQQLTELEEAFFCLWHSTNMLVNYTTKYKKQMSKKEKSMWAIASETLGNMADLEDVIARKTEVTLEEFMELSHEEKKKFDDFNLKVAKHYSESNKTC